MKKKSMTQLLLMVMMLGTALLAYKLIPYQKIADNRSIDFQKLIPEQFAEWKVEPNQVVIEVPAEMQATLNKVYSETISRTYVNKKGERIMMVIAYGKDQGDSNSVHRPEVCYPAQGFTVEQKIPATFQINERKMDAIRLVAKNAARIEPITYWITVGDYLIATGVEGKLAQLKYGLRGQIPDGLLFRVSTLGSDKVAEYEVQKKFINDLYRALPDEKRNFVYGKSTFSLN
ncbi:EpsI family protein [Chitinibacter bivalviorum]|uniref:EpsI family protein n=1 Tax=Chitinibacter bivalviorum TaxID=2739434 RepID=A0A7H9BHL7_9NEIS|nr:exosortase-associated protein EpsI, B-type [Chitinibacter bivalviorum]QLG88220.1 EpsI family protein [Chitinibacter bivalviorum]